MYQALYRKYRPQTFDDVVGQKNITETLKNQLLTGKLSHAYLFTGSRGTGKTSCAKILAKAVNCLSPVDGSPCNRCSACRSIDSGACMDVLEIDAASNNGVDNVRALRDDAAFTPSEVKMRVYIIDEVHMLSMSAFNALLKIIEEPPEHLLFILATTELHKVPTTILSRCQRFAFRRLSQEDIAGRINYVAYQEKIEIDNAAIRLLARLADGALRDGLSLLDQCASASSGTVSSDSVYRCLGLAGQKNTAQLLQAVAHHDSKTALSLFSGLYASGKDLSAMLGELCTLSRDLLVLKAGAGPAMLSGVCIEEELQSLLPQFSAGELLRITDLLQKTASGFARSANRRIDAELCLMQLCNPTLSLDAQAMNARLSRVEEQLASGQIQVRPVQEPEEDDDRPPLPDDGDAPPEEGFPMPPSRPQPQKPADDFWPRLKEQVRPVLKPPAVAFFGPTDSAPLRGYVQGDTVLLVADDVVARGLVDKEPVRAAVAEKASALLGRPVQVRVTIKGRNADENALFQQFVNRTTQHYSDITHITE